ncbi:MAG: GxxExxY protein [bacterium]|nr:GxxExxY protein [bacterium]
MESEKIIYKDLCYEIVGICFKIQDRLGRFCKEKQYSDEFEKWLIEKKIKYKREFALNKLENNDINGNIVDFIIEEKLLIDFKAKKFITKEDYGQMQRYLVSSKLKLGLLINFRESYLKPKRVINSKV